MFVSRKSELQLLDKIYRQKGNGLLVIYGREGIGKTALLKKFTEDKPSMYYLAGEYSEREQIFTWKRKWERDFAIKTDEHSYSAVLNAASERINQKVIMVIDEFHLAVKGSQEFMAAIQNTLKRTKDNGTIMMVLITSDIRWAVQDMKKIVYPGSDTFFRAIRLNEFRFMDVVSMFPDHSMEDNIIVYGVLGGVPKYLNDWDQNTDVKSNIIRLFLKKGSIFHQEVSYFLKNNLRELALYNTVLSALANDCIRLNDLYERTGFSRAKISVYLKNLAQIGVVEKIMPYDLEKNDPALKGLYEICDPFLDFWYKHVFPNFSYLEMGEENVVYDTMIAPYLNDYIEKYFIRVCKEFMDLMNHSKKLPIQYIKSGTWYGKEGTLDIAAGDESGKLLMAACMWRDVPMDTKDLEKVLAYLLKAGIEPDYYYIFSKTGFSNNLEERAGFVDNLNLIGLDQF